MKEKQINYELEGSQKDQERADADALKNKEVDKQFAQANIAKPIKTILRKGGQSWQTQKRTV